MFENTRMAWLYMRTMLLKVLYVVLLITLFTSCSDRFNDSAINVDQLCSQASIAFEKKDFAGLLTTLEKQFGIARGKMTVTEQGIFIPTRECFVEERGYFVAKPSVSVSGVGTDPAFERVKGCIYRYRIKG
jgi:hypothetical protein